ncbi:hypothetical protein UA75_19370 [Actinoalloteichus sp. GBA129-24]|uniref:Uncharacterized protein n=1 Tax=Actinoalloteichus fjordicus TaxID=1612552 RepID=A0AAC9LFA2_9PSEU|nr:hypothetical protein UA74_18880 [Actinoalloteichus fjordicus]APU21864.1 hypothetical protein UA75_19370 [Actinoalloteichus sp. GBA129-24]
MRHWIYPGVGVIAETVLAACPVIVRTPDRPDRPGDLSAEGAGAKVGWRSGPGRISAAEAFHPIDILRISNRCSIISS